MTHPMSFGWRAQQARLAVCTVALLVGSRGLLAQAQDAAPQPLPAPAAVPAPAPEPPPATPTTAGLAGDALTLEAAVRLALTHNERARTADLRERAASARVDKAGSFFLPDITLEGGYTRLAHGRNATELNALGTKLALNLVLFDGRGFPLYRQAKLDHEASELERAEQKRLLAFDAASLFVATIGQERVRLAAQTRLDLAHKSVTEATARLSAGLASSNDVTQVELELAVAERTLAEAQAQAQATRLDLGYVVGQTLERRELVLPTALVDTALATAPDLSVALRNKPRGSRLDIKALRKRAQALQESANEPGWRFVPTLSLAAEGQAAFELPENPDGQIGVKLTWKIWDGGERSADSDEREALARIGGLDLDAKARHVEIEVKQAMVTLERGQRTGVLAQHTVEIAAKNSQETTELYRQGLTTALQVADASERLFQAEVDLTRARYDMAVGLLDLRAALGLDPFGKEPH